ncbi:uncharacterized protein CEXT_488701 [Caerostris extrusa]|uniref:Uncharacterized protein n=1 Tax=Caerostris extrusa TaxID=172846 RepID=A0AAV4NSI6_CAEEX|nr:uncharacterized protein CEXT_488701 [Caerostris extrusa]
MRWLNGFKNRIEERNLTLAPTLPSHSHLETFLETTILALVPVVLVDGAVPVAPASVGEVPPDTPLEEGLASLARELAVVLAAGLVSAHHALYLLLTLTVFVRAGGGGRLRGWGDVGRVSCRRVAPGCHCQGHRWACGGGGGSRATVEPALGGSPVPGIGQERVEGPQLQGSRNRWGRSRGRGPLRDQQLLAFREAGHEARPLHNTEKEST